MKAKPKVTKPKTASVKIPTTAVIRILVESNPRLKGTLAFKMFDLYRNGITVEQFLESGGRKSDIRWDAKRNHVSLTEPAARKGKGGKR